MRPQVLSEQLRAKLGTAGSQEAGCLQEGAEIVFRRQELTGHCGEGFSERKLLTRYIHQAAIHGPGMAIVRLVHFGHVAPLVHPGVVALHGGCSKDMFKITTQPQSRTALRPVLGWAGAWGLSSPWPGQAGTLSQAASTGAVQPSGEPRHTGRGHRLEAKKE